MKKNSFSITFFCCVVLSLLVAAPLSAQSKKDQAKKLKLEADKKTAAQSFREAADLYGKWIQLEPVNAYAHYRKGFAHFKLNEDDQAVNDLTAALNQGWKPLDIYSIRHYVLIRQGKYDAALKDIEKALLLAPNDISYLNAEGESNYAMKGYSQALAAYQKVAKIAPNRGDSYYNIARVSLQMNDTTAQAAAAETALLKGTTFPAESYYLLGDANQKLKISAPAIDAYQKALNLKPKMYQIYQNLSDIYKSESRFGEAIDILKKGLLHFVNDGRFYTELGLLYSLAGRYADAVTAARSGVDLLPNEASGYTNLCRAYNETRDFNLAVIACNNSLRIRPDDGETYFYLGNAYLGTDKSTEATRAYASAVRGLVDATTKNPEQSDLWYMLGNSYFGDKQFDKAIEAYLKCLAISPKFWKARANLGISYTRKKNKSAALEQYNMLVGADAGLAALVKGQIDKM